MIAMREITSFEVFFDWEPLVDFLESYMDDDRRAPVILGDQGMKTATSMRLLDEGINVETETVSSIFLFKSFSYFSEWRRRPRQALERIWKRTGIMRPRI
jgi:hypothetical protein